MQRLVIFVNGLVPAPDHIRAALRQDDVLLAVDGGSRHLLAMGLVPSVVVGDLDSLSPDARVLLEEHKVHIQQFPQNKDQTDLELALLYGLEKDHREILIVGALGGRLDQTLGNLALVAGDRFSAMNILFDDGAEEVLFIRKSAEIHGKRGEIVSLIPWSSKVTGVRTKGLRWPLNGETLLAEFTRGISNETIGKETQIEISTGVLLCIHSRTIEEKTKTLS